MSKKQEKSFDDLVYEDEFYEEDNKRRELVDSDEADHEEESSDDTFEAVLVCEDCEHRWDDSLSASRGSSETFCPLCGSSKVMEL